jgi:hypothetical protein
MQALMGGRGIALPIFNLGAGRGGWPPPRPGRLTPGNSHFFSIVLNNGDSSLKQVCITELLGSILGHNADFPDRLVAVYHHLARQMLGQHLV